ncbi:FecCD family ABC transporter permease [Paenibacillus mucilaginosus]|uniref:Ferrichrome ABC transporter permease n=1 Tax=Paenibacillus mucilaginosus (strain KNP414) TaxID=1036673 RepID=F8FDX7_PAEMK|nr:iron ABC transporter permease [Paenibacillus mucilaginosus]AEI43177.1 Ferrichrome ABC transporter permease [Paenibacillus mucilaginosus KNP414]MCG7212259.1 iron ABC transporter permease [Paenibacillus mucilaginosus]
MDESMHESMDRSMDRNRKPYSYAFLLAGCLGLILLTAYISLTNGAFDITVRDTVRTLLRLDAQREFDLVIFEFRLPRIVIAALVGMGLGMAGTVTQSLTRNSLADPGILGINAGAGMAMVLFLFFVQDGIKGTGWGAVMAMPLAGWLGGLGAALLIYVFAYQHGRLDPQRLLLAGIAVSSGLSAVTVFITLKMNAQDFEMSAVWVAGSIYNANWKYIASMLPWLVVLTPLLLLRSRQLDLFRLHEDSVRGLGVAVEKERRLLLLCSIGIVSACVSVSGGIGFIGLMAPHLAGRLAGSSHHRLLPLSGMIGALLVLASDLIGRTVFAPVELPVGIVISLIGAPYFVWLMYRSRRTQGSSA